MARAADRSEATTAMLRASRILLIAMFVMLGSFVPRAAHADPPCSKKDFTGRCVVEVDPTPIPPSGSGDSPSSQGTQSTDSGGQSTGAVAPCTPGQDVPITPMNPQPPPGDPAWKGHSPSEGVIYLMWTCGGLAGGATGGWGFVPNGQAVAGAPAPPDPAEIAAKLIATLDFQAPTPALSPPTGTKAPVGLPIWMWATGGELQIGPIARSATEGGVTVDLTAVLSQVSWNMGDGTSVTCAGPGTPYSVKYPAAAASPDCGHTYLHGSRDMPGGNYLITATGTWLIEWHGGGKQGEQQITLAGTTASLEVVAVVVLNR